VADLHATFPDTNPSFHQALEFPSSVGPSWPNNKTASTFCDLSSNSSHPAAQSQMEMATFPTPVHPGSDGGDDSDAMNNEMRGFEDGSMSPSPSALPPRPARAHPLPSGAHQTRMPTRIKVSIDPVQPSVRGVDPDVDPPPGTNGMIDDGSLAIKDWSTLFRNQITPINPPPELDHKHGYRRREPHRAALGLVQWAGSPSSCAASLPITTMCGSSPNCMSYCIVPYSTSTISIGSCSTTLSTWPCRRERLTPRGLHGDSIDQVVGPSARACGRHQLPG